MNPAELTAIVSTLSIIIADCIPDNNELTLLSAVLTQIGDTLNTISIQRDLISDINSNNNSNTNA